MGRVGTGVRTAVATAAACASLLLAGCAVNELPAAGGVVDPSGLTGTLSGKGSSAMSVAQQTWIADFQTAHPGVTINYSPDGSGAGREAFVSGAVAYAGSDRPFHDDEMQVGGFARCALDSSALNLPVYISPIAVIHNVAGVPELRLDPATIAGIFSGGITRWDDPRIAATNPGARLPDAAITAVHRSDDSGTTANFTDYLAQAAGDVWGADAGGEWPDGFGGEAAKGNAGVVDAVTNGTNTIGYADASQAGDLGVATVQVGDTFIGPTAADAALLVDASPVVAGRRPHDLALELDRTAEGVYPIALVSYALVCERYERPQDARLAQAYVGYMISPDGQRSAAAKAGSAPLSDAMTARLRAAVESIR